MRTDSALISSSSADELREIHLIAERAGALGTDAEAAVQRIDVLVWKPGGQVERNFHRVLVGVDHADALRSQGMA